MKPRLVQCLHCGRQISTDRGCLVAHISNTGLICPGSGLLVKFEKRKPFVKTFQERFPTPDSLLADHRTIAQVYNIS